MIDCCCCEFDYLKEVYGVGILFDCGCLKD